MNPRFYMSENTSYSEMTSHLDGYDRPAIIFDEDLKVTYKNKHIVYRECRIKTGVTAKTFLPLCEIDIIDKMAYGAIQIVGINTLTEYAHTALVGRFRGYYVLVLKPKNYSPLFDNVLKANAIIGNISTGVLSFCTMLSPDNKEDMMGLKKLSGEQLLRHSKISKMFFLASKPLPYMRSFFNPAVALEFACKTSADELKKNKISLRTKFEVPIYMCNTNEAEYHAAIASMLAIAARCTFRSTLLVESLAFSTLFTVRVSFDSDIDIQSLTGSLQSKKALDWQKLMHTDVLYLQCLAEGYDWYFNISAPKENRLCFTLTVPLTREQSMVIMKPRGRNALSGMLISQFISLDKYKK